MCNSAQMCREALASAAHIEVAYRAIEWTSAYRRTANSLPDWGAVGPLFAAFATRSAISLKWVQKLHRLSNVRPKYFSWD